MGIFRFIFGLFFLLVLVMYSVQNLTPAPIGYYNYVFDLKTVQVPVIIIIFFSMIAGFLMAWMVGVWRIHGLKSFIRKQKKEIKNLMKESDKKDGQIATLTGSVKSES